MQSNIKQGKRRQSRTRKRPHSGILTLDDLDMRKWKHTQLINQLRARYKTDKGLGKDKPNPKTENFLG
jgi:hypothetical protein